MKQRIKLYWIFKPGGGGDKCKNIQIFFFFNSFLRMTENSIFFFIIIPSILNYRLLPFSFPCFKSKFNSIIYSKGCLDMNVNFFSFLPKILKTMISLIFYSSIQIACYKFLYHLKKSTFFFFLNPSMSCHYSQVKESNLLWFLIEV